MKIKTKKNYLLGILLSAFLIIWIINITNGEPNVINTNPDSSKLHTASLRSLFLGDSDVDTGFSWMRVNTWWSSLDILNWLIVWSDNSVSQWSKMVVIGWGRGNSVNASNAGIAWGSGNAVDGENWAIGWWLWNMGKWIIAWGNNNKIDDVLWVILWWFKNISKGGIVLWGSGNMAWENSMAFWQNAKWDKNSFAWNAHALQNSARIDASGWMLIGTYSPVSWVYLVVSGSVKLWSGKFDSTTWWVWVNENGCIKASDGDSLYTLGRSSESVCGVDSGCQFGTTILHNGDKVTAYTVSYAKKCEDIAQTVTCKGWKFYNSGGSIMNVVYPYCYDLSPDPILSLTWWIKQCSWTLPANTEWVNKYFKQNLQNGERTPRNKTLSYRDNNVDKECSYKCIENYTWDGTSCVASTKKANCEWNIPSWAEAKPWHWTYTQTWNGSTWTPTSKSWSYDASECGYKCKTNYTWNETAHKCELWTHDCGWTKPTWNGYKFWTWIYTYGYTPTSWTYTGGTLWPCLYKCDTGYIWSGGKCVEPVYQCTWAEPVNATLVVWSDNWLTANTERKLYASATEANWKKCAYLCNNSERYIYNSDYEKCEQITSFCKTDEVYKCVSPAIATNTWYSNGKYTWDCKVDWISEPVEKWCFKCKDGYTLNGSKCENEKKYKICYMWSNKYRVADNEPLPFLLDITVRCGIWVWEVFNKTYTINTWDLISTWWLPNKSCTIINAQYEPSLFNPEDRVEYIWTCEWSCFGCPSGIVENGGKCISYKSSYSCECQDLKVISYCVNWEWDEAPASFSSCTAYTWQDQICVWYRREYSDPAFRHNDPDYYSKYGCTRQDQPVGGDCSVLCAETNNHECVKDNNISPYDTININTNCCVCWYANVCNYDFKLPNKPVDSLYGKWGRDESYRIDLWSQHPSWPHNWDLLNW